MSGGAQLVLLGGPAVVSAAGIRSTRSPARRQASLALAYLCLAGGRPVPSDELAEACWPTDLPASWAAGLRRIVSEVRAWLHDAGIAADVAARHGTYRCVLPDAVTLDVDDAVAAVAGATRPGPDRLAEAQRAWALLEPALLPGLDAPWLDGHRGRVGELRLQALEALSDALRVAGEPDAAAMTARRAIDLDPLRESAYRLAMAAHAAAGRVGSALRVYEECRTVLVEELGAPPSPTTALAYHHLLVGPGRTTDEPAPLAPADRVGAPMAAIASQERVAAIEARLEAIQHDPHPDPRKRLEALVALGRARWALDGATAQLLRVSLAAGHAALHLDAPGPLAQALALASTTTGVGRADEDAIELAEAALAAFPDDDLVAARALALLAEHCTGLRSVALAEQAVARAQRSADPALLLDATLTLEQSVSWMADLDRRRRLAAAAQALLEGGAPRWRLRPSFAVLTELQGGSVEALEAEIARMDADRASTSQWEPTFYATAFRGVRALLAGDLTTATARSTELFGLARAEANAAHAAAGLHLAIAREAGGIAELLPLLAAVRAQNPAISAFASAHVLGLAVTGDHDAAREGLAALVAEGLGDAARDHVWLLHLGLTAEAAAVTVDRTAAAATLRLLEPYAGQLCAGAHGTVALSSVDTYRGMLQLTLGDAPAAVAALGDGLRLERRLGAPLLAARSAAWLARAGRALAGGGVVIDLDVDGLAATARAEAGVAGRDGLRDAVDAALREA